MIPELEKELATDIYQACMDWSGATERSQQDKNFVIGISSLGHCSEKVRRMLNREQGTQTPDKLAAFIGTWVGEGVEQAIKARWPEAVIQSEISLELETDQGGFTITGHPDIILPDRHVLLDCKSVSGLAKVGAYKLFETDKQKRFQRHGYAAAAWRAGTFGDCAAEDVLVGNLWIDRGGDDHEFIVRLEPLDLGVLDEMADWLSTVVYSWRNDIEAPKEPSREFCATWCEFFDACRKPDTDVSGLIDDPIIQSAAELYREGAAMEKQGKHLKNKAKSDLSGVNGSTGQYMIRWVTVGETVVPETVRRGYERLSITSI